MKNYELTEVRVNMIIETFADYVENYYGEADESDRVSTIVDEHFDEFIDWAYDDFIISEAEQEILKNNSAQDVHKRIKKGIVKEFLMILHEHALGCERLSLLQSE